MHATTGSLPNHSLYFLLLRKPKIRESFSDDAARRYGRSRRGLTRRSVKRARTSVSGGISPDHFHLIDRPETLARICAPLDRRRYQDGGFNGQWTSQLAPFQCSGTLFPPPPPSPFLSFFTSLHFPRSFFSATPSFTRPSDIISSCVHLVCFLPSSFRRRPESSISRFSPFRSFDSSCRAKLPVYMRPGRLPG